ncbi:MAG: hypothetical protein N4A47_07315 [Clostridia bacterium]|jgi:hypothetical protein|nr:hypothetical protein [Clostridia bacterium]
MKKNMNYNFEALLERIKDAHLKTDGYEKLRESISNIKGNTFITGTGGSYAVASFAKSVLKNEIEGQVSVLKPRDVLFENIDYIDNIIGFSYSGKSPSIKNAVSRDIQNKIIITADGERAKLKMLGADIVDYGFGKKSFISIGSSIVPMSMLLRYGLGINAKEIIAICAEFIKKSLEFETNNIYDKNKILEVFGDARTYTPYNILESNIIESGMMPVIKHEKNDYSHGRSILNYNFRNSNGIYLINEKTSQDEILVNNFLPKFYNNLTVVESENVGITGEFELAVKSMFITKEMAKIANIDLSNVNYPEDVRDIYSFDELSNN